MKADKINILKIVLSVSSGVLLTLSFPKTGISWLAWIALVPLLVALRNLSSKKGFVVGFCSGIAHYLTLLYWLAYTMKTYGHLPYYVCIPVLFLLSAYMAIYIGIFSTMLTRICATPLSCLFITPLLWVSLEYIRSFLFTGFPWELMGYSQFSTLPVIQIADILGVYGVSFCIALSNAVIFLLYLFLTKLDWHTERVGKGLAAGSILILILISGLVWSYGEWRIQSINKQTSDAPSVRISIVQGNIDQAIKWDPAFQLASTKKYITLSLLAKAQDPDLIVWPETATPFYFLQNAGLSEMVQQGIHDTGVDFLIGSPSFLRKGNVVEYYNSAYLVSPEGDVYGKYDKAHLVPFGEYIPFHQWLPFLEKMVAGVGDFQPGKIGHTIPWRKYSLGVQICYEIIFPNLSRAMVNNNSAFLINITNDAWYGKSSAPYQHFSMAVFRAVENRKALIRSANTGISGFIDPSGRVTASTSLFQDAILTRSVPILHETTFYSQFGDLFALTCLVLTMISGVFNFIRH